jgi:hypothetical protein
MLKSLRIYCELASRAEQSESKCLISFTVFCLTRGQCASRVDELHIEKDVSLRILSFNKHAWCLAPLTMSFVKRLGKLAVHFACHCENPQFDESRSVHHYNLCVSIQGSRGWVHI